MMRYVSLLYLLAFSLFLLNPNLGFSQHDHLVKQNPWMPIQELEPVAEARNEIFKPYMFLPAYIDEALIRETGVKSLLTLPDSFSYQFNKQGQLISMKLREGRGKIFPRFFEYDEQGRLDLMVELNYSLYTGGREKRIFSFAYSGTGPGGDQNYDTVTIERDFGGPGYADRYEDTEVHQLKFSPEGKLLSYEKSVETEGMIEEGDYQKWIYEKFSEELLQANRKETATGKFRFYKKGELHHYVRATSGDAIRFNFDYWVKPTKTGGFLRCRESWLGATEKPKGLPVQIVEFDADGRIVRVTEKYDGESHVMEEAFYEPGKVRYNKYDKEGEIQDARTYTFLENGLPKRIDQTRRNMAGKTVGDFLEYEYTYW